MAHNLEHAGGAKATTLASDLAAAATTINVVDGTGYPTGSGGKFYLVIDRGLAGEEKVLCLSRTGNSLTLSASSDRGVDGTSATTHTSGATVEHCFTATEASEANTHLIAVSGVHGLVGSVVGTSDTQTLTGKTLTAPTLTGPTITGTVSGSPTITTPTLTTPVIGSFASAGHAHTAGAGGGVLVQANTHGTPDTDSATSSLHHTIGVGATQAAAGDHTHADLASLTAMLTAYTSYTPSLTNAGVNFVSHGTGATRIGRYKQIGKMVDFTASIKLAELWDPGGATSGTLGFTLPVAPNRTVLRQLNARLYDGTFRIYIGTAVIDGSGSGTRIDSFNFTDGDAAGDVDVQSIILPYAIEVDWTIYVSGTYEAV